VARKPPASRRSSPQGGLPDGPSRTLDLGALDLVSGAAVRLGLTVPVDALRLSGERYTVEPATPSVELEISRASAGWLLRARSSCEVVGPCWRCLGPARLGVTVDVREFQGTGRDGQEFIEGLDSNYLDGEVLDVETWLRDAVCEELPSAIVCSPDCLGLCATCGGNRNDGRCACDRPAPEPAAPGPFAGLGDLLRGLDGESDTGT
jgi:uncharacterized protein